MRILERTRLCGHNFCGQAADGEDKRTWGLLFIMFVDLMKAYDSVPRNALWTVFAKWGVCASNIQC